MRAESSAEAAEDVGMNLDDLLDGEKDFVHA